MKEDDQLLPTISQIHIIGGLSPEALEKFQAMPVHELVIITCDLGLSHHVEHIRLITSYDTLRQQRCEGAD